MRPYALVSKNKIKDAIKNLVHHVASVNLQLVCNFYGQSNHVKIQKVPGQIMTFFKSSMTRHNELNLSLTELDKAIRRAWSQTKDTQKKQLVKVEKEGNL
jgi:hypothetical protein